MKIYIFSTKKQTFRRESGIIGDSFETERIKGRKKIFDLYMKAEKGSPMGKIKQIDGGNKSNNLWYSLK